MDKFCFVKFKKENRLIPGNLSIPVERILSGFTIGQAIKEKLDEGPVDIVAQGEVIGQVTGYKIKKNRLIYIEEYFESNDDS